MLCTNSYFLIQYTCYLYLIDSMDILYKYINLSIIFHNFANLEKINSVENLFSENDFSQVIGSLIFYV